ncbi:hypothetical protein CAI21_17280 [Alkalilimnicola ehrlichii]|uniref:Uncharacterized protein n=1 Tax=Alkalilimnicola ehrlichii TaxID=351052 RepID=A0A3E0WKA2_9GAMM|nr:hypothetical protein [Alkalilimnicola ehrlichii]RFA26233.1 hypothetical protein CAI21_17280 [Alkalilimnicola ehrlichii]RFA33218.1 hypothetical protein CAL65_17765 [Alkalilimnicola ehrlichii]
MNIETLSEKVYEDLNGRITSVEDSEGIVIYFLCDDWNGFSSSRVFQIQCFDVKESDIQPTFSGGVLFTAQHPLLWNHNETHGYLYYSSEPANRYEILGRVWEAHEKVFGGWRPLTDYANTYHAGQFIEFCKGTHGQLAQGPRSVLDAYQSAVAGLLETKFVASFTPEGGYKALVFDTCFVICKSVAVTELTS